MSFAALSPPDRQLLAEAAADAADYQRTEWAGYEARLAVRLREAGVVVIPIRDPAAWRALVRPVYDAQGPEVRALIDRIKATR